MSLDQPAPEAATSKPSRDGSLDKKNALIERLNEVVLGLSEYSAESLGDSTLEAIHSEVDRIESLLGGEERDITHDDDDDDDNGEEDLRDSDISGNAEKDILRSLFAPTKDLQRPPELPVASPMARPQPDITVPQALEIVNAAEQLASRLTTSIQELQKRREESDHIHTLLITRLEKAAERIVYLESEFSEMDADFEASQSELRFLRIQMQAIEAQYSQHVPEEEDEELSQSIMNWKDDWEDLDKRSKARRMKRGELLANVHASLE